MTHDQALKYLAHWLSSRVDPLHKSDLQVLQAFQLLKQGDPINALERARISWFIGDSIGRAVIAETGSRVADQQAMEAWDVINDDTEDTKPCDSCNHPVAEGENYAGEYENTLCQQCRDGRRYFAKDPTYEY